MSKLFIPENYKSPLDVYKTQKAISFIKQSFQARLSEAMNLKRVSAPLFVTEASGLNDNLNGTERPVTFDVPAVGESVQVVHSLAKWKRLALHEYHFYVGNGLYTATRSSTIFTRSTSISGTGRESSPARTELSTI